MPNPFKEQTTINYYLSEKVNSASLVIFDMNGRQIKRYAIAGKGEGKVEINGGELYPGMYIYTLIANGKEVDTKRMILTN